MSASFVELWARLMAGAQKQKWTKSMILSENAILRFDGDALVSLFFSLVLLSSLPCQAPFYKSSSDYSVPKRRGLLFTKNLKSKSVLL